MFAKFFKKSLLWIENLALSDCISFSKLEPKKTFPKRLPNEIFIIRVIIEF